MIKTIDVDQERVLAGALDAINIRYADQHIHASRVGIQGPAVVCYDPLRPKEFGARAWVETAAPLTVVTMLGDEYRIE